MRLLFFVESLNTGGKERRIVELIKGLIAIGTYEIQLVLTKRDIHYDEIKSFGVRIHFLERGKWKKDPSLFYKFFRISKEFRPHCIHVWGRMVAIYAIPSAKILNIPLINNEITDAPEGILPPEFSLKLTMRYSDEIVANSLAGIEAYGAPEDKSSVIYNGFDFVRLDGLRDRNSVKEELGIYTKYVVMMIGSFSIKKDYPTFIRMAENILKIRNDVTFLGIGAGNLNPYVDMISENNKRNIMLISSRRKIEDFMNIADIGVLATFTEGISNSVLEFMALSKPVVVAGEGGCRELIMNNENGFLLRPSDYLRMSEKILYLLDKPKKRELFGQMSNNIVKSKFSFDKMIMNFDKLFKKYEYR